MKHASSPKINGHLTHDYFKECEHKIDRHRWTMSSKDLLLFNMYGGWDNGDQEAFIWGNVISCVREPSLNHLKRFKPG